MCLACFFLAANLEHLSLLVPQSPRPALLPTQLLNWYDKNARRLPWRATKGKPANAYHVAVSEFMLQQTTVATVIPYFERFIKRWPDFKKLARAKLDDVRAQWAGLGYYRRASYLHALAKAVSQEKAGRLPEQVEELKKLPGLGPYAAAAIAAIAFNKSVAVVDGNVERVISRLYALKGTGTALREAVRKNVQALVPEKRAGDFAQALMELGALVCRPKNPTCPTCPWTKNCAAKLAGTQENFPHKKAKAKTGARHAVVYVVTNVRGEVLVRKREEKGLLAGLWEFPSTPWEEKPAKASGRAAALPAMGKIRFLPVRGTDKGKQVVKHVFSHFTLYLSLQLGHSATTFKGDNHNYRWMKWQELRTIALPTVMQKVARLAQTKLARQELKT